MELPNHNVIGTTSFQDLPYLVKFQIFKQLVSTENLKNARLVCSDWYFFLQQCNHHKFKLSGTLTDANDSLKLLQSTVQDKLATLTLKNCSNSLLPILSSTRIKIPLASHLILQNGNSSTNILQLLRYYCTSATKTLTLTNICLANVGLGYIKSSSLIDFESQRFRLSNLSTLNIYCTYPISIHAQRHLAALNGFLQFIQIPTLRTFVVRFNCELILLVQNNNPNIDHGVNAAMTNFNVLHAMRNIISSFGCFIKNHAKQISHFELCLFSCNLHHVLSFLPYLQAMVNLQDFKLSYTGRRVNKLRVGGTMEQIVNLNDGFVELFKSLTKLKSLVLMTSDQDLNVNQIFKDIAPRLHSLSFYIRGFSQLNWLHHVHPHPHLPQYRQWQHQVNHLSDLDFFISTRYNPFADIINSKPPQVKLLNLRVLKLIVYKDNNGAIVHNHNNGIPFLAVYEDIVNWIITMTPNLKQLQLYFYSDSHLDKQHRFNVAQMKRLLTELNQLEQLTWNKAQKPATIYTVSQGANNNEELMDDDATEELRTYANNNRGLFFSNMKIENCRYTSFIYEMDDFYCIRVNRKIFTSA